jgi:cation-transporting P-type ATPase F
MDTENKHWHNIEANEVADLLKSDTKKGLEDSTYEDHLEKYGENTLTTVKPTHPFIKFMMQFHNPLVYILLAAGTVTLVLEEWVDSSVILGVVLINSIIGYIQEAKAEKALDSLKNMVSTDSTVIRNGKKLTVPASALVPGDLLFLQSGDKVPADIRLVEIKDLQIDESTLTGESVPVIKNSNALEPSTVLADRVNMAFGGTLATYGQGYGIVVLTGDATQTGQIANLIQNASVLDTPLTKKIAAFSHWLLYIILTLAVFTFIVGVLRNQPMFEVFMASVALAVGAIPEGLPAAVTITLAIGVKRMAKRKAIIRKLPAVETLGSTTIICSDKTGTLTENQMTVQRIYSAKTVFKTTGTGYGAIGKITRKDEPIEVLNNPTLGELLRSGMLCNDSHIEKKEDQYRVIGDPTEGALLVSAQKAGFSQERLNTEYPRVDTVPFESDRQYMATLHEHKDHNILYLKGSIERILALCTKGCERVVNGQREVSDLNKQEILQTAESFASMGLRVLGFATLALPKTTTTITEEDLQSGLHFLGLQAMIDPPRAEAINAVETCKRAGIHVKMITGDHILTASAIAGQLGLNFKDETINAITGSEIEHLDEKALAEVAISHNVFARVAPEQKLKLVQALQGAGNVCAMTGDGVNDAPALKQADIGVAMGITGTEVAKDASDMVLVDDNFASIAAAVEEGRGVFDNLTKFIIWTLPTNLGEGLVILTAIMLGTILPILPVQILWINMTTAILLGMMLAFEPKEPGIMHRSPRNPDTPILTPELIVRTLIVGILMTTGAFMLFQYELNSGASETVARTVAVNVFVFVELFYLFNCRSLQKSMFSLGIFSNMYVIYGVIIMTILQLLFTYTEAMNLFFHTAPLNLEQWSHILMVAIGIYFVVEIEKYLRYRNSK